MSQLCLYYNPGASFAQSEIASVRGTAIASQSFPFIYLLWSRADIEYEGKKKKQTKPDWFQPQFELRNEIKSGAYPVVTFGVMRR